MRNSERWFCFALGIWLFGAFAYFVPAATWNPVSRFDLTRAIVERRTLSIDEYAENTGDRSLAAGHWYTDKAPIPSILAVPAYAVFYVGQSLRGRHPDYTVFSTARTPALRVTVNHTFQQGLYVCSLSTAGLATAILGVLLFRFSSLRLSPRASLFGAAGAVLGTPLWPYATSFYGHGVAAVFLFGAYFGLFADPRAGPSTARVRAAGACLALAVGSEYIVAIPAFVVALAFLTHVPRAELARSVFGLAVGAVVPVAILVAYHSACFGAPWRTGYSFLVRPEFVKGHAAGFLGLHLPTLGGLYGLSFGRSRGLFFLAPAAALGLAFTIAYAARRRDVASSAGVVAFVALLLANAGYYMWWGGAAAGPRHLVPVVGFLALGLAAARRSRLAPVIAVLVAISAANALALTAVGLEAPDHGDALFDYAYRRLVEGEIAGLSGASNLGLRMGLSPGSTLVPILAWLVLGGLYLLRRVDAWVPDAGAPPDEGPGQASGDATAAKA